MADLKYHPIKFELRTDKESYYEGEKITFNLTLTNTDKENTHPVLLPHTQNTGPKLFCLSAYDKAKNTTLLRYTEDPQLKMLGHDTGTVEIKYLKPLEQIIIPIYLNDFDNNNYHTQNASHHSFGVPLFAGIYNVIINYKPMGIAVGDSIYNYYNDTETEMADNGKSAIPGNGFFSNFCTLKIKRNADTLVTIEHQKYYIKTDGNIYYYFNKYIDKISTGEACVHITSLPPDSCSIKNEYYYSQFTEIYNEYIVRFDDEDIREYRRFTNRCPEYLYTERYNEFKKRTNYQCKLPDSRFYSATYNQPAGNLHQETYCSEDGTLCIKTTYIYNKKGILVRKKLEQTQPCTDVLLNR